MISPSPTCSKDWDALIMRKKIVPNTLDLKSDETEVRCFCGSLIARICETGVELKCRRCKRFHLIPILSEKNQ